MSKNHKVSLIFEATIMIRAIIVLNRLKCKKLSACIYIASFDIKMLDLIFY